MPRYMLKIKYSGPEARTCRRLPHRCRQEFQTRRNLTLDRRAFLAVSPLQGGAFELLPAP